MRETSYDPTPTSLRSLPESVGWIRLLLLFGGLSASLLTSEPALARGRKVRGVSSKKVSDTESPARILNIESRRALGDKTLLNALKSPSPSIVSKALIAAGHLGDPGTLEELSRILNRKELEPKLLAAQAMAFIPDETAATMLVQHLQMQREPEVLATIYQALGLIGQEKTFSAITQGVMTPSTTETTRGSCMGIGMFWSGSNEKSPLVEGLLSSLIKLSAQAEPVGTACAFALSRYRGEASFYPANELLESVAAAKNPEARALSLRAVGRLHAPQASVVLAQQSQNGESTAVRIEAIKGLALQPFNEAAQFALQKTLQDPNPAIVFQTLDTLFYQGGAAAALAPNVESVLITSKSPWVRSTAMKTLASLDPIRGRAKALAALAMPGQPMYGPAIFALALNPTDEDLGRFVNQLASRSPKVVQETVEALVLLPEERFTPALKAAVKKVLERADVATTSIVAQLAERYRWKDFASALAAVYPLLSQTEQLEAKVSVLNALAAIGDASHLILLDGALKDGDRSVVVAAVQAIRSITSKDGSGGRDETSKIPPSSRLGKVDFKMSEIDQAVHSKVILRTKRGLIVLKMRADTPLTALSFVRLIKKGFYLGKTFHRVVPGFVVQGGDPRADGYGGPGHFIYDELSLASHERGTVGLATSGRDTGGSQFFINLSPNFHLNGRFTLFADVVQGLDIAEKLEPGDKIQESELVL